MPPRWMRRLAAFGVLLSGSLLFAANARPDACAEVWTLEHHVSPCCRLSGQTRITRPGGDCCDYGAVDARDPGATSAPLVVAPPACVHVATVAIAPPVATSAPRRDASIPERPPDRARRTTVFLI